MSDIIGSPEYLIGHRLDVALPVTQHHIQAPDGPISKLDRWGQLARLNREREGTAGDHAIVLPSRGYVKKHGMVCMGIERIQGTPPANFDELSIDTGADLLRKMAIAGHESAVQTKDPELIFGFNFGRVASLENVIHGHIATPNPQKGLRIMTASDLKSDAPLEGLLEHNSTGERIAGQLITVIAQDRTANKLLNFDKVGTTKSGACYFGLQNGLPRSMDESRKCVEIQKKALEFINQQWAREGVIPQRICAAFGIYEDVRTEEAIMGFFSAMTMDDGVNKGPVRGGVMETMRHIIDGQHPRKVDEVELTEMKDWGRNLLEIFKRI